jgi:toxin ParE1/3/4
MSTHRLSPTAGNDLIDFEAYFADRNPSYFVKLFERMTRQVERLARFPRIGRPREEILTGLRSFPLDGYVIFFRAVEDGIEIIRVLYGARDVRPSMFEDF